MVFKNNEKPSIYFFISLPLEMIPKCFPMLKNSFSFFLLLIFINTVFCSALNLNPNSLYTCDSFAENPFNTVNACQGPSSLPEENDQETPCPMESSESSESKESSEFEEKYNLSPLSPLSRLPSLNGTLLMVYNFPSSSIYLTIFSPPPELNFFLV